MKPKKEIKINPKHWYQWLSPSFWRMKKVLEFTMNSTEYQEKVQKAMIDEMLYGNGFIKQK